MTWYHLQKRHHNLLVYLNKINRVGVLPSSEAVGWHPRAPVFTDMRVQHLRLWTVGALELRLQDVSLLQRDVYLHAQTLHQQQKRQNGLADCQGRTMAWAWQGHCNQEQKQSGDRAQSPIQLQDTDLQQSKEDHVDYARVPLVEPGQLGALQDLQKARMVFRRGSTVGWH